MSKVPLFKGNLGGSRSQESVRSLFGREFEFKLTLVEQRSPLRFLSLFPSIAKSFLTGLGQAEGMQAGPTDG